MKDYDCSCWVDYPNDSLKKPNGKWICKDKYEYIGKSKRGKTRCKKKEQAERSE